MASFFKKTILVTGGAGFVGSHLCDALHEVGHEVLCLDNFFTGSKSNIRHLLGSERFELIRHDVNMPMSFEVDEIYHLACPASPYYYQIDPVQTVKTNVQGMINVLELARRLGARVVHASTSEVYGDPAVHPQIEEYRGNVNVLSPRACYDEGKRCAETICWDYRRQYNVDVRVARIFNTYGPRMAFDDGRVVSNFIVQALRGRDITIFGDGTQTRSFQYVSDLIAGLTALMEVKDFYGPVNIGNPEEYTILNYAKKILGLIGSTSQIKFLPLPADDPKQRRPDISLAKLKLNWQPTVPVIEGMKKTVDYFKGILNDQPSIVFNNRKMPMPRLGSFNGHPSPKDIL
ncbi:MAG: NAD-dependent epimerase/dehydratase [Parcubacteria group bacterium GW2011_GWA2_47_26]|nr:MAG: NAD-dependent epimerase/dehydratase [Parcubacteria group bacterium GW2011_GWA2_47_26]